MANIEKRLDVLQDLKHKVQELMISESEESKATDEFTTKIEEDMATFDGVVNELVKERRVQVNPINIIGDLLSQLKLLGNRPNVIQRYFFLLIKT